MSEDQRQDVSSPKRFFKNITSSPFRSSDSRQSPTPEAHSFRSPPSPLKSPAHTRSHSHDFFHRRKHSDTNWTSLIPPLPSNPNSPQLKGNNLGVPPKNRHSIAVSPPGSRDIPDMLQPSPNPRAEPSFGNDRPSDYTMSRNVSNPFITPSKNQPSNSGQAVAPKPQVSRTPSQNPSSQMNVGSGRTQMPAGPPPKTPDSKIAAQRSFVSPHTPMGNASHSSHPSATRNRQIQMPGDSPSHRRLPTGPGGEPQPYTSPLPQRQFQMQSQSVQPQNQPYSQDRSSDSLVSTPNKPPSLQRNPTSKRRKDCKACGQPISGQFVRAMNNAYHIDCFTCYKCGVQCSSKFFPHDITDKNGNVVQVPLCEYDYFKELDLICFSCDSALRGPYITALGNKYHLEHFKCSACGKVFESDESYYEHENNIYCHYHYSKLFATKCEGCQSSIVKQFVELFKGGRNQQWHPECYMVYKFWNVSITAECVGLQEKLGIEFNTFHIDDIAPDDLLIVEQQIENAVMQCWLILSGFEEIAASCISEMLLCACTGKRNNGLSMTGRLVVFVEILFNALDFVQGMCLMHKPEKPSNESHNSVAEEIYSVDAFDKFQTLRKEPRNISGKLMSYLAILRKSKQSAATGSFSTELLSVVTGTAHYLKLMIRIGLNNALTLNKIRCDTRALDGFLRLIKKYEEVDPMDKLQGDARISISSRLAVPYNATDSCTACSKSIEKACVAFKNSRWHLKCFECSNCHRKSSSEFKVESFLWGTDNRILCTECSRKGAGEGSGYVSGFVKVSDLSQLAYLLKIAIFRSKFAINKNEAPVNRTESVTSTRMTNIEEEPSETETDYSRTLSDITSLRTKRESQKLSNSIKKNARKSVILEAPEAAMAKKSNTTEEGEERQRQASSASMLSFVPSEQDSDQFDFSFNNLKIRDDPPDRQTSNNLDRTYDLLKNEKALTLDDIPRIVAAEQAREQRPNAYKHHNSLYLKKDQPLRTVSVANDDVRKSGTGNDQVNRIPSYSKYYSELSKNDHFILQHIAVEALLEMKRFGREELVNMIPTRKSGTFWDKFKFGGGDKSKHVDVFGANLKEVSKKYGVDSDLGVGPAQLRIPILVDDIIKALRQKDMSVEGIFRLNGNIKNLRELTEQINKSPLKSPDFSKYSAVQLAALLKKWLRELPNPLLTCELYDLWISSRREKDPVRSKRILQLACCMLPRSHRNLLEVLLYFFNWVASFAEIDEETGSKMDIHNLATVIAPNILSSKAAQDGSGSQSSESHFYGIEVVNSLIEMNEELAVIPNDVWDFYQKCQFPASTKGDTLSSKDIFGTISKVSKENPQFFSKFMETEPSYGHSQNSIKKGQAVVHNPV
ncbi:RhoGAP domain family protein [Clavispora lusitaniae]|uniref:Rho-GTPase-activating protein n=1 Tax=Clavispora lusitaniae (strain ATCC 42720) TaxID=306902 RepID=C4Y7Y4_CLAL4|nr:uncharacterized protein CLUG_04312 [Clavispora lusitaniae ATCC 42720]EEQ40184.1 hypothetical protein CLUG_04312 [Clavispora lusitaniae ATCC 42720]KAF7581868.1 RhoGAP domain family protein [Clavispora lusitaniae]